MKRICKVFMVLFIIVICNNMNVSTSKANSNDIIVDNDYKIQVVDDIDNYPYPETAPILYDCNVVRISKITVNSPGQIKVGYNNMTDDRAEGEAWISTDILGKNIVGKVFTFNYYQKENSWFLSKGTYYLLSKCTNTASIFNASFQYEKAKFDNSDAGSSLSKSRYMNLTDTYRGFLTDTNPNEYYSFELQERTAVTFKFSFDTSANRSNEVGHCTLLDKNEIFLREGLYNKTNGEQETFTYTLEKGLYFIKMNGMLGNTTLSLKPMYYDISLVPDTNGSWTKKPIKVKIATDIDFLKVIVLKKDIKDSLVDNNMIWSENSKDAVACDGLSFKADKSGIYSVRITDNHSNNTMEKIYIKNIDTKKPKVKGVTDGKAYKQPIKLTWSDKQSGINIKKTTLNGKPVTSGITVSKEGKYTLKVYDNMGNYEKKLFYIDNTAPTAGVENGKTYSDTVTLKIKDSLSGVKKILVDDVEQPTGYSTMYLFQSGDYTVKIWDNAGNYKKVTFRISKKY